MALRPTSDGAGKRRRKQPSSSVLRVATSGLIVCALVVTLAVALWPEPPERRRAFAQILGLKVAADLDPFPLTQVVPTTTDESRARRGTEGGYRRAVIFTEPQTVCDIDIDPVDCGAKLELFRRARDAARRAEYLQAKGEKVQQLGAAVLRFSPRLNAARREAYTSALRDVMETTTGFSDLTRLDVVQTPTEEADGSRVLIPRPSQNQAALRPQPEQSQGCHGDA